MRHFIQNFSLIVLVSIILIIASCKKSDHITDPVKILEGNNWKMVDMTVDPAQNGQTNIFNTIYDPCEQDNIYQFKASNVFALDEGATKCYPTDLQSIPGTWSYDNNTKMLRLVLQFSWGTDDISYIVKEVNDNSFKTQLILPDNGINYTYTATYQKQ